MRSQVNGKNKGWMIALIWLLSCSPGTDELVRQGKQELGQGAYKESIETFTQAIEEDSLDSEAYNGRAVGYFELEKFGLAIDDLNKAIWLDSASYKSFYNRANARREIKNYELALQDYSKAISLRPNIEDVYINRGVLFFQLGNYAQALDDFQFAVKLDSTNVLAQFNRARTALALNQADEAAAGFRKVVELQPDYAEAFYWMGLMAIEQEKKEEACLLLQKARDSGFAQAQSAIDENC